jgi:hypothetical protein
VFSLSDLFEKYNVLVGFTTFDGGDRDSDSQNCEIPSAGTTSLILLFLYVYFWEPGIDSNYGGR